MPILDNVLKLITQGAGTVNAITATLTPAIPPDSQCMVIVRSIGLNNSTSVIFQLNGWPAYPVKARGNTNIRVGDTGFANYEMIFVFNTAGSYWQLLNPATSVLNEASAYTDSQINVLTDYINNDFKTNNFLDATSSIQEQLDLRQKKTMPFYVSSTISHTGTTSPTVIASSINLVGVLQAHDYLLFEVFVNATNNANNKFVRWYISESNNSLVNEVLVGAHLASTGWGSNPAVVLSRFLKMKSTLNGNIYLNNSVVLSNQNNPYAQSGSPMQTAGAIDFAGPTAKYLVLVAELASALDTINIYEGHSTISTART